VSRANEKDSGANELHVCAEREAVWQGQAHRPIRIRKKCGQRRAGNRDPHSSEQLMQQRLWGGRVVGCKRRWKVYM